MDIHSIRGVACLKCNACNCGVWLMHLCKHKSKKGTITNMVDPYETQNMELFYPSSEGFLMMRKQNVCGKAILMCLIPLRFCVYGATPMSMCVQMTSWKFTTYIASHRKANTVVLLDF